MTAINIQRQKKQNKTRKKKKEEKKKKKKTADTKKNCHEPQQHNQEKSPAEIKGPQTGAVILTPRWICFQLRVFGVPTLDSDCHRGQGLSKPQIYVYYFSAKKEIHTTLVFSASLWKTWLDPLREARRPTVTRAQSCGLRCKRKLGYWRGICPAKSRLFAE